MPEDIKDPINNPAPEFAPELPQETKKKFRLPKWAKITSIVLGVLLLVLVGLSYAAYSFAQTLKEPIQRAQVAATGLVGALQGRDLISAKSRSDELKLSINDIQSRYQKVSFLSNIPILGAFVKDGQHGLNAARSGTAAIDGLIVAIEPYSDLLGFKAGATQDFESQSIEEKVIFLAETLNKISPQLDTVSSHMNEVKAEIDQIDPNRYPESFRGQPIRSRIISLRTTIDSSAEILTQSKPLLKILPSLLGNPTPKLYMLLFQNDKELRPTGGFMTAYAYLKVTKGKIEPLGSYDIYDLDARWGKKFPAPAPIKKYLPLVNNWNLRDMNLNPDFKLSMDTFMEQVNNIGSLPKVDGVIALDTQFPVEILKVIGPIGVGGWGNFSAANDPRCDCPQVVYALEEIADRPVADFRSDRKAVLGPLMHSMLANAMGSPKHTWPTLLNVGLDAIKQKHLLFYFFDEEVQKSAEDFNAAGRIKPYEFDYLHVNDSNLGGAKTDMFLEREVDQEIENANGKVTKTVTLLYNNPRKGDNCNLEAGQLCLNGTYRDWVRLYVPKGSKLISVVGSEVKESVSEDLDKTVFEAFFTMRPQSSSKLVFKYELPEDLNLDPYRLFIQKQPGKPEMKYSILYNGSQQDIILNSDIELTLE